ncbi:AAA family ATPase [Streptomyces sp. NPDC052721]|uniref:ATP-binding protein n=1 Tax=Streptomyces sp. NPDC052721 TaxID=3154955 RepID=UPI003427A89C
MEPEHLMGRDAEVTELARLWGPRSCPGQVVLLLGEPGIGKTALLEAARRFAEEAGHEVLRTVGVQAEAQLPFAGLHQLLRGLLWDIAALSDPESQALRSALGEGLTECPPEAALINRGAAQLLRRAVQRGPVTVLVDDLQWLDPHSGQVVGFLARRASDMGFQLVATQRAGAPAVDTGSLARTLTLGPLSEPAAEQMLARYAGGLGCDHRRRLLAEAQGNPLALRELAAGGWERMGAGPLSARLERTFGGRGAGLPAAAQDLLLVAAADGSTDLAEIGAAAALLLGASLSARDVQAAVHAQLVRVRDGELLFRHPLVRSGVLQAESLSRRQRAHAALAQVVQEPFRRAWHHACSVVGPDDEAGELLAEAAERVWERGAALSAVEALERSAGLTSGHALRAKRLLRAAEFAVDFGRGDLVERLVTAAMRQSIDPLDHAKGQWLREIFRDGVPGDVARVSELCVTADDAAGAGDPELALNLLLGAALRCWWAETGPQARAAVVSAAEVLAEACDETRSDPRWLAVLAVAEPLLRGEVVCAALDRLEPADLRDPAALRLLGMAAHAVGHEVRAADLLDRAETLLRQQGRIGLLTHVLSMQVVVRGVLGHWDAAEASATEGLRLAEETGQPLWTAGTTVCHAQVRGLRGDAAAAFATAAQAEVPARVGRLNCLLSCVGLAKGLAWSVEGDDEAAYREFRDLFDPASAGYHARQGLDAVALFAEAAVRTGKVAEGRSVLTDLERLARITPSPLLSVQLPYARAVLAHDADAGPLYVSALSTDLSRWPWVAARLALAHGAWLRRTGRPEEATTVLRDARVLLHDLGAVTWVARADAELAQLA